MAKRILDIVASLLAITLTLPLWLIVAVAVKLDSRGPVFHRAMRAGKGGRPFTLLKFRSMVTGGASRGPDITQQGDQRITRVGRLLRETKIDELPQFINVLRGEMSIVGPRPEDPRYVAHYTLEQRKVLSVRPGITSLASIKYRHEEKLLAAASNDLERVYLSQVLPDKLCIDLAYIERQSLLYDLAILVRTLWSIFDREHPLMSHQDRAKQRFSFPNRTLFALSRFIRQYVPWVLIDALVIVASLAVAWSGRSITATLNLWPAFFFGLLAVGISCSINHFFGLYRRLWRYASSDEVVVIAAAAATSTVLLLVLDFVLSTPSREHPVPVSVVIFMGFFSFAGFVGVRYRSRVWKGVLGRSRALREFPTRSRVLIFGAGEAGQLLAWRILNLEEGEPYQLVGFIDDNPEKIGLLVHGAPVLGNRHRIPEMVAHHYIDMVIIAIHNLSPQNLRDILNICEKAEARIKVLPNVFDYIGSADSLPPIRDVTTDDLLGRPPVQIDRQACQSILAGKTVLVTGAAGSIGSELSRQIAAFGPCNLLLLDNNESGLFDLAGELEAISGMPPIRRIIGDVTNRPKMQLIFEQYHPEVVFHAAAYKHVPLMEEYPEEAVRVNVLGTWNVAELACQHGAERFVFISTDKAVNPTSVMGATKRLGELLIAALNAEAQTLCTGVRFGNVLGSRGSVVPTFEKQIAMGGPVTITHPEMTRYFMSIPEAVSLVIQAATLTQGGDLFVLDMGEQVRIEDLAKRLVRLRGLRPGIDIAIKYTGIRPGEKLHEELTGDSDKRAPTSHPSIYRVNGNHPMDVDLLLRRIHELVGLAEEPQNNEVTIRLWEVAECTNAQAGS